MRLYVKPELKMEAFDVEDWITVSGNVPPSTIGDDQDDWAAAPDLGADLIQQPQTTVYPYSTVDDPSGAFQQQVTGGNPIQEGLNNLYENFLNRF